MTSLSTSPNPGCCTCSPPLHSKPPPPRNGHHFNAPPAFASHRSTRQPHCCTMDTVTTVAPTSLSTKTRFLPTWEHVACTAVHVNPLG